MEENRTESIMIAMNSHLEGGSTPSLDGYNLEHKWFRKKSTSVIFPERDNSGNLVVVHFFGSWRAVVKGADIFIINMYNAFLISPRWPYLVVVDCDAKYTNPKFNPISGMNPNHVWVIW